MLHFETVAWSFSNSAASHLFDRLRSAGTTFTRFKSFISISMFIAFGTNLVIIYEIRMKISVFSLLNVIHVITNDHLRGLCHPVCSVSATPSKARLIGFCNMRRHPVHCNREKQQGFTSLYSAVSHSVNEVGQLVFKR